MTTPKLLNSKTTRGTTRRRVMKLAAASAALPLVHIRSGRAAGKVSIAFWDHWVPSGNAVMQKQVDAWAAKNQVEVQADFITAVGQKNILTIAAEAQAKTGHDVQAFPTWEVHNNAELLEPMDDVMKRLTDKYGQVNDVCNYLAKIKGHWLAVPTSSGTQYKGPCGRISVLKDKAGLDVVVDVSGEGRTHRGVRCLDLGRALHGGGSLREGGHAVRHRPGTDHGFGGHRGCAVPRLWCRTGGQGRQHHGQVRQGPRGIGARAEAGEGAAGRCRQL